MPCRASVQCARSPAPPPPGAGAPMEPTASVLRAVGVASRPGSRRPRGVHRQTPGDERPLRRPTARTSGSPPGDGGTADDVPSFREHAGVSFSGALCRMFPTDGDDAGPRVIQAAPACAALAGTRRSPATFGSEATRAPPPPAPWRSTSRRNRPCKAGPRPVPPSLCAPRLLTRPVAWRSQSRHT